jgi:hypothetical protein
MAKPFRLALALPLLVISAPAIATDTGSSSSGSDNTGVGSDREPVGGSQGTSGDTKEHDRKRQRHPGGPPGPVGLRQQPLRSGRDGFGFGGLWLRGLGD